MTIHLASGQILAEQAECLQLHRQNFTYAQICAKTGLSLDQVRRRIKGAKKAERLDPKLLGDLHRRGVVDLAGLRRGWLIERSKEEDTDGIKRGSSLYFDLGPDEERINFADAVREVLSDIPRLPPITEPLLPIQTADCAHWVMLADLHVGGHYGDPRLELDFNWAMDDLVRKMGPAEHAVLVELGDLLDANDHKGVTPASGNNCDVIRENPLADTQTALRLMRRGIMRLLETHSTVEVHLIPGNHDPSAYVAVMIALAEHFASNPRVDIVVSDDMYRTIHWGECALFPHHGHSLKWPALKGVWTDQFPDEWAAAKMFRMIATGHFHHERSLDLGGCIARQFGTLHRPNEWAKGQGMFSYGGLSAIRVHKTRGYDGEAAANIRPMLRGQEA